VLEVISKWEARLLMMPGFFVVPISIPAGFRKLAA